MKLCETCKHLIVIELKSNNERDSLHCARLGHLWYTIRRGGDEIVKCNQFEEVKPIVVPPFPNKCNCPPEYVCSKCFEEKTRPARLASRWFHYLKDHRASRSLASKGYDVGGTTKVSDEELLNLVHIGPSRLKQIRELERHHAKRKKEKREHN